jgi:amino acid permease
MFQSPLRVRHLRCADARTQDSILMTDATVPIAIVSVPAPAPTLRRELGRWNLTAIGVNQVIGSAVFILPSQVAAQLGNWSPIAFLLVGFASLLVALCFAEVGSRFDVTGGAYLYARAAFGRSGLKSGGCSGSRAPRSKPRSRMRLPSLLASIGRS